MRLRNGTVATVLAFITSFLTLSWYTTWQNGKEKLIAYQREFLALKERLRIAEHRISQRSSELNAIVQQFKRVGAETNGSKAASNKFSDDTLKLLKELTSKNLFKCQVFIIICLIYYKMKGAFNLLCKLVMDEQEFR